MADRQFEQAGLARVMAEHLRLGVGGGEGVEDPSVDRLPLGFEQALVGGVADQRVLEAVVRLGRAAAAEDELGLEQLVESGRQLFRRLVGDRGEQAVVELAADAGGNLGDLLDL